jgi:hypothetical protein
MDISVNDANIKKRVLELIEDKYVVMFSGQTRLGSPVELLTLTDKGWAVLSVCADRPISKPEKPGPGKNLIVI